MDWTAVIGRHGAALRRVVSAFVAMVGVVSDPAALAADRPTLARHRHRALLRLVRPAEAAARRLVIVLALAVPAAPDADHGGGTTAEAPPDAAGPGGWEAGAPVPPRRPRRQHWPVQPKSTPAILFDCIGTGIVLPRALSGAPLLDAPIFDPTVASAPTPWWMEREKPSTPRRLRLPLADPARRPGRVRRVPARDLPRIWSAGHAGTPRPPTPPLPAPDDRLDAMRLVLRIDALAAALDDLEGEAERFRRWQARRAAQAARDAAALAQSGWNGAKDPRAPARNAVATMPPGAAARRFRRVSPLRTGRPPGGRKVSTHEVHAILDEVHGLAFDLLARRDTS